MPSRNPDPETVATNIVEEHGRRGLRKLLAMFDSGESGTVIAEQFGVSRQRVHQWKQLLGECHTSYAPDSRVAELAKPRLRR